MVVADSRGSGDYFPPPDNSVKSLKKILESVCAYFISLQNESHNVYVWHFSL